MSISVIDLERLGETALHEFSARTDTGRDHDLESQAQRLEAKLEQLYAVAVTMAGREPTLEGVTSIWKRMVMICDSMAKALASRRDDRSSCSEAYDRILDIRNACEDNRALHA